MPLAELADVRLVHRPHLHRIVEITVNRQVRGPERNFARIEIWRIHAVVRELQPGQRAHRFNGVGDARQHRHVLIVPDAQFDERRNVAGWMNLDLLGAHHAPAALRLDRPHGGECRGIPVSHAVAMRHLIESVLGRNRADPHRLEQDIVSGIAGHDVSCRGRGESSSTLARAAAGAQARENSQTALEPHIRDVPPIARQSNHKPTALHNGGISSSCRRWLPPERHRMSNARCRNDMNLRS